MGLLRVAVLAAVIGLCGCEGCDAEDFVDAGPVMQTLTVSWKVADLAGAELPCEQVDGRFVTVTFYRMITGDAFTEVFDCFRKTGARELAEGDYMIGFELADSLGTLVTSPTRRVPVRGDTTLDEITFRIAPTGGLVFTLDAVGQPVNCTTGAEISSMTIELYHADDSCEPATLAVEGAAPYTVNCASPPVAPCIEKTQDVTGMNLPAGEYRLHVVGSRGAVECWEHNQRIQVRAAGLSRTLVLPLMKICT